MTTRLLLVRHGETDWNREGRYQGHALVSLNEEGRVQARRLAERLRGAGIEALYSSDLPRAYQTAQIIGEALGMETRVMKALREVDMGAWTGLTLEEVEAKFPQHLQEWHCDPLRTKRREGESYLDLYQRVVRAGREIGEAHPNQAVLMVTHGGNVKCLVLAALGMNLDRALEVVESFAVDNASLTILEYGGERFFLRLLNDTCHLKHEG